MNIAIFSPNQNPYSETFIQAHKLFLKGRIFYYFGKHQQTKIEGQRPLFIKPMVLCLKIFNKLFVKRDSFLDERVLVKSLNKNKIDVILIEFGNHAYRLLPVLRKANIPFIVIFHGYEISNYERIKSCNNYKEVFKESSKIVAVSKVMKEKMISLGCQEGKIIHTPCAPHYDFEIVKPRFNKNQFLFVGRFIDKKAPYYTIMAFKQIVDRYPNVQLFMAGDGLLMDVCKNIVKYFNLEKAVIFLGVITPDTYRVLLSESLAFVQHSITASNGDMEGTPVSILEASAAGLPVISTYHAGIPDVIIHGETGLLCEEHDVDSMANHMIALLDDMELAKRMGQKGKENILRNFSMNRHIQTLQTVLEEAVRAN